MRDQARISSAEFKAVMGCFASGVHVITSADGNVLHGMTATAVCSMSADPPSLLVVVNRSNRTHPIIARSGVFAVHALSSGQEHVAVHFAAKVSEPFADVDHSIGRTGCPIILDVHAFAECFVAQRTDFGTHTIFVGEIVTSHVEAGPPLLFHSGRFGDLKDRLPAHA